MLKALNEKKVLKKLGIADFRHLTKDKVIKMASMLEKMDPEVAKKALEQFPNFATTTKEILCDYKNTLDKALELNNQSTKAYYDSCNLRLKALQNELDKEEHTFDEKKFIFNEMYEISKEIGEKDSENKKFLFGLAVVGASVVGGAVAALASALGGNSNIEEEDKDS